MATTLTTRPRFNRGISSQSVEPTVPGFFDYSPHSKQVGPDPEAPEDAIREEEGPESRVEWSTEAPDAGCGEDLSIERDFTHGRSRS